jgi:serine/threonine protein kinase
LVLRERRLPCEYFLGVKDRTAMIPIKFAVNGSLANPLPGSVNCDQRPTRIVRIIAGVAMRFLHSQNIPHCNLTPENIVLDSYYNMRIIRFE